jgi:hypothetical protein
MGGESRDGNDGKDRMDRLHRQPGRRATSGHIRFFSMTRMFMRRTTAIDFHILNFTRPEGGGCIVIRRRPITL